MITLKSHGFKFSRPEANIVFDVSYMKNPWRDLKIRKEKLASKRKKMIMKFMNEQKEFSLFVSRAVALLRYYHLFFPDENIVVAFCCSAGEYRSPAIVDAISKELKENKIVHIVKQSKNSKL